jgi:hypothetical protein
MALLVYFNKLRKKSMKKIFFVFGVIFSFSCSNNTSIERNKFTSIYAETLIISANTSLSDALRKHKIDSLLNFNRFTEADFKAAVKKFSDDPEEWKEIYKEIIEKVETKKQR